MGAACSTYRVDAMCIQGLVGDLRERDNFEGLCLHERIILRWIFRKWFGAWTGFVWLRIGTDGCLL